MYRVWFNISGEWQMKGCGKFGDYAFKMLEAYAELSYRAYIEYINR